MMNTKVHKFTLSPLNPTRIIEAETIGYFSGDLPFVVVHVDGEKFTLGIGQSIPIGRAHVLLENPFRRTAELQMVLNGPLNYSADYQFSRETPQAGFVTYEGAVQIGSVTADPAGTMRGIGVIAGQSRSWLEFSSNQKMHVTILPYASSDFLAGKPAGIFADNVTLSHTSGDEHEEVVCISGKYTSAEYLAWMAAVGYDPALMQLPRLWVNWSGLHLEPNTAAFVEIASNLSSESYNNIRVIDKGTLEGPAYV